MVSGLGSRVQIRFRDSGKENGYWGYRGAMEKKMETTI